MGLLCAKKKEEKSLNYCKYRVKDYFFCCIGALRAFFQYVQQIMSLKNFGMFENPKDFQHKIINLLIAPSYVCKFNLRKTICVNSKCHYLRYKLQDRFQGVLEQIKRKSKRL